MLLAPPRGGAGCSGVQVCLGDFAQRVAEEVQRPPAVVVLTRPDLPPCKAFGQVDAAPGNAKVAFAVDLVQFSGFGAGGSAGGFAPGAVVVIGGDRLAQRSVGTLMVVALAK